MRSLSVQMASGVSPDYFVLSSLRVARGRALEPADASLKVPHMGWNCVEQTSAHPLWKNIADASRFYFVHSYALPVADFTLATANHATELSAVCSSRNFVATQFHPERSAAAGARLLANFLAMR